MRWLLMLLAFAACTIVRPGGLPVSVIPGKMPGGADYPDPMRQAKGPRGGRARVRDRARGPGRELL